jgi:DNA-binding GntR family transcriptional regulator
MARRLAIARVVKMPVEAQATDALRDSIVNGAISPGARITEIQISEQMNLSRATVRAALHKLAKEGLLILIPYTGWTVLSLTSQDVWELYTLRSAVERLAAQLVARSMDSTKATRLEAAFHNLEKHCERGDVAKIAEADFALHQTIIALSDHSRLSAQYGLIEQQTRMYVRSSDALVPVGPMIVHQHKPIVDAILRGDAEAAGNLSEQHNLSEGQKLSAHLKAQELSEAAAEARTPTRKRAARRA